MLGLKLPNMLGRAEKLTFQFSYGTKETSYGLSFFKPQPGFFERKYVASGADVSLSLSLSLIAKPPPLSSSLTLNLYKVTGQFPWSSLKETDRGLSAELNVSVLVAADTRPPLSDSLPSAPHSSCSFPWAPATTR